jgi:alpha-L-rhamnosidase
MRCPKLVSALVLLPIFLAATAVPAATSVGELRCEHLENPQGIDTAQPRLSWLLQSGARDVTQSAYQVLVASSEKVLARDAGDLWDSGRVVSDESILVPYAGKPLGSRQACFWKVRIWDGQGIPTTWTQPARWSMGMLNAADWHAQWIGLDGVDSQETLAGTSWIWFPEGDPAVAAPIETNYFRRIVTLPAGRTIKRAYFDYSGDDECQAWLGQSELGAHSDAKSTRRSELTARLEPGKSYALCLACWNKGTNANPAGAIGLLTVEFTAGAPLVIPTGDQWKVSKTPEAGWNKPAFDDSKWPAAKVLGPAGMQPWGEISLSQNRRQPARYLRKEFAASQPVLRATVSFCGLGLSELYVNGEKIGNAVLSPAFSQYDKRDFYVTYDVTKNLRRGANALGVILGNGRFYADRGHDFVGTVNFGWPKLLLNLRVEYADGSSSEIVSDGSWQLTTSGPIVANNDYDGEEYDARRELPGWSSPGYDVGHGPGWHPAQIVSAPDGVLAAQMMEPIRITGTRKPISVKEIQPGVFLYDLGQNLVGWCRLRVAGAAGTQVSLRHAETLQPDGSLYLANLRGADVTDVYTLRGNGRPETWEPRFVTHGFRYVEVTGFPGRPNLAAIEGCVVNDDLPVAGTFRCSNELINRVYTNIVWGTRGNYRSLPTDCPQRDERQGWLGDRSEECRGESYLFDIEPLYAKWRQDMTDAQRPDGEIPDVAPAFWTIYTDDVTWPSSAIIIPEVLERQFADPASLTKNYDSAARWIGHVLTFASNNIVSHDSFGDWCVPPEEPTLIHSRDPARQTDQTLLATAYFYHDLRLMEHYATELGRVEDAARWHRQADDTKFAFNEKFLDHKLGQYSNGTATSCVLPLAFGLVPDDFHDRIFAHLVDKLEREAHGHVGTGLIGGQFLNRVLSDNGRPDLCYTIATQKDYPGWGYMVEHGATTIWELWNGNTADPSMNSGNHVMLIGDLVIWLYEDLAGIAPDAAEPGFKHIIMRPKPVGDLDFVRATHRSPYGWIVSEWYRRGLRFDWQVEIPPNTTATVYVPASKPGLALADGVSAARFENGRAVFELGSGKYHFVSE